MGSLLAKLGAKIAGAASGPLGWLASLLIDRVLKFGWSKLQDWIAKLKKNSELKKETKKDESRGDIYAESLKDGAKEKDQINSSLDILNGTDRTHHD